MLDHEKIMLKFSSGTLSNHSSPTSLEFSQHSASLLLTGVRVQCFRALRLLLFGLAVQSGAVLLCATGFAGLLSLASLCTGFSPFRTVAVCVALRSDESSRVACPTHSLAHFPIDSCKATSNPIQSSPTNATAVADRPKSKR